MTREALIKKLRTKSFKKAHMPNVCPDTCVCVSRHAINEIVKHLEAPQPEMREEFERFGSYKLKKGDHVLIVGSTEEEFHEQRVFVTTTDPWILGGHTEVVHMDSLDGEKHYAAFAIKYLRVIPESYRRADDTEFPEYKPEGDISAKEELINALQLCLGSLAIRYPSIPIEEKTAEIDIKTLFEIITYLRKPEVAA